jgi:hypothetical protein
VSGKGGGAIELHVIYDAKIRDSSADTAPETG